MIVDYRKWLLLNKLQESGERAKVRRQSFPVKMMYSFVYPFSSGIVIYAGLMTFSVVVTNITKPRPRLPKAI